MKQDSTITELNKDKCVFCKQRLILMGHIYTDSGLAIDQYKIKAINNIETSSSKSQDTT